MDIYNIILGEKNIENMIALIKENRNYEKHPLAL